MKLFSLMVALIVAGLAVVGGTWASNTQVDYTTNPTRDPQYEENNQLDYNVEFNYYTEMGYKSALGVNVFNDSVWCPGKTEIVYLEIKNNEGFPVDVALTLVPEEDTGNSKRFGEVLTVAWLTGESDLTETVKGSYGNWIQFRTNAQQNVKPLTESVEVLKTGENGGTQNVILSNGAQYIALAVHMEESASSDYAKLGLNLSFNLRVNADQAPTTVTPAAGN